MKTLFIAVIGLLAASLVSSNSFASTAGYAGGIQAGETAVKIHYHRWRRCHTCLVRPQFDACHHYRLCHYPLPNIAVPGADCCCSLLWPF